MKIILIYFWSVVMYQLSSQDLSEIYSGYLSWQKSHQGYSEQLVCLPEQLGRGYVRSVRFNANVHIMLAEQYFHTDMLIQAPQVAWPLEFIFTQGGCTQAKIEGLAADSLFKSHAAILYMPYCKASMNVKGNEQLQSISIKFSPDYVTQWLQPQCAMTHRIVNALQNQTPFFYQMPLNVQQQLIFKQLLDLHVGESVRRVYMESKTLELVALFLDSLSRSEPDQTIRLKADDQQKLYQAKAIIADNPSNPPSLAQLAQLVGINEFKLKSGFKRLFGSTVFSYVRQQRMEQARLLLETGRYSVTEVAMEVGYASLGHFTEAFKSYFGITPGRLLSAMRVMKSP